MCVTGSQDRTQSISAEASLIRSDSTSSGYNLGGASSALYDATSPGYYSYSGPNSNWEPQGRVSSETYEEHVASPSPIDYVLEPSSTKSVSKSKSERKAHSQQRRPSNRDEFDGPHQFLQRPPPDYIAQQEINLHISLQIFSFTSSIASSRKSMIGCLSVRLISLRSISFQSH